MWAECREATKDVLETSLVTEGHSLLNLGLQGRGREQGPEPAERALCEEVAL